MFTGLIIADMKETSGRDVPQWVEADRYGDFGLLKVRTRACTD